MDPTFRAARAADLQTVLRLMQELFYEDPLPDQRAFDLDRARAALVDLLGAPQWGTVWLICDGETPVGYFALTFGYSLEFHGRDAFIDEMYIRPTHRERGWGSQAIRYAEGAAKSAGVRAIHLEVGRDNTRAQAFYRKAGYADHARYLMTRWIAAPGG